MSKVVYLNPLNEQGLPSSGFNPLKALDRKSPHFFQHCSAIAEALIRITGKDPFFDTSARNLVLALIMWEVWLAENEGRDPLLKNVRGMLTGDLPAHAQAMFDSGDFVLASLAGQFREKNKTNDGIVASASTQTQWLLDQNMLDDLAKDGIDWAQLKNEATHYICNFTGSRAGNFQLLVASGRRLRLQRPLSPGRQGRLAHAVFTVRVRATRRIEHDPRRARPGKRL